MADEKPDSITLSHDGRTGKVILRYGKRFVEMKGPVSGIKHAETWDGPVVNIAVEFEGFEIVNTWEM